VGPLSKFSFSLAGATALGLLALAGWHAEPRTQLPAIAPAALVSPSLTAAVPPPASTLPQLAPVALTQASAEDSYYAQLRAKVKMVQTPLGHGWGMAPDTDSRLLLAKSAARMAGLSAVGLGFKDVYGLINAETSWVPRTGSSKDGTPNLGVAQFEPATARALGLRDPNDLVESVHAAARHMKDAAIWSGDRIGRLHLGQMQYAERLREGVSIYYNLSSRGRNLWNGRNTSSLPTQTRQHIQNTQIGALQAATLDAQVRAAS